MRDGSTSEEKSARTKVNGMARNVFLQLFREEFPYDLTSKQEEVACSLFDFLFSSDKMGVYILRGYAGTGKTLLVSALVRVLKKLQKDVVLLAPTGRAAKVLSGGAGFPAYTVHKQIYRQRTLASEKSHFDLDRNNHRNALFIVDESSMISARYDEYSIFGTGNVLHDLLNYVYRSSGCRLLFVGDNAQLPPVGEENSPALMAQYFSDLDFSVSGFQLLDVLRQKKNSGILENATMLRSSIREGKVSEPPVVRFQRFQDIRRLVGGDIVETLQRCYEEDDRGETIVLTRSNKQANVYNQGIRSTFFGRDGGLQKGDMVMVVRNNYYWIEQLSARQKKEKCADRIPMDFIANGDIAEITDVEGEMEFFQFHFADVSLRFPDYDDFEMRHVRVLLDVLNSETPAMSSEQNQLLFAGVSEDYADERSRKKRMEKIRQDPNFNALQIKYAYAVTCHKAQGGQWRNVFLDQGWLPPDGVDLNYYRWLYTAFTRATQNLYLVSWPREQSAEE